MIVLDASAILEILLRTPAAAAVEKRVFRAGETLHVPHLVDVEAAQVLRRYAAAGDVTAERGHEALSDLAAMPVTRYPHDILLPRVWDLRQNLTAHDAVYVALAELLDAPLLTRDKKLALAAHRKIRIELI